MRIVLASTLLLSFAAPVVADPKVPHSFSGGQHADFTATVGAVKRSEKAFAGVDLGDGPGDRAFGLSVSAGAKAKHHEEPTDGPIEAESPDVIVPVGDVVDNF